MATVESIAAGAGVPVTRIGLATGERIIAKNLLDIALSDATVRWRCTLPEALGAGTTEG
jgi:hypothetical protein